MNAAPSPKNLSCPRCGYAFRGEHESWSDAWPLEGRCAECGLSFLWRDIFNPQFGTPRWLVEARSAGLIPWRRAMGTLIRSCIPSYFWSRVSLNHPIRRKPLFGFLALLWIPVLFLFVTAHVITLHEYIVDLSGWIGAAAITDPTATTLHVLTHPFSGEPIGAWVGSDGFTRDLPSPRSINLDIYGDTGVGTMLPIILSMPLLTTLSFIALPVSRRRARVRREHLVRITAYAYALLSLPIAAASLAQSVVAPHNLWLAWQISIGIHASCLGLGSIFALWWWHAAIRRYLRMEHSVAVALSVWIIGSGTSIAIASLIVN